VPSLLSRHSTVCKHGQTCRNCFFPLACPHWQELASRSRTGVQLSTISGGWACTYLHVPLCFERQSWNACHVRCTAEHHQRCVGPFFCRALAVWLPCMQWRAQSRSTHPVEFTRAQLNANAPWLRPCSAGLHLCFRPAVSRRPEPAAAAAGGAAAAAAAGMLCLHDGQARAQDDHAVNIACTALTRLGGAPKAAPPCLAHTSHYPFFFQPSQTPTPYTTRLPALLAVQALPNMQPGYCVLAQSFEFGGGELAAAALAGPEQGGGSKGWEGGSGGSRGSRDGSDEEMPQAAERDSSSQQDEGGSAGAAGGAAAVGAEGGGGSRPDGASAGGWAAGAAALEDRLQECLLEAFAAGTGAQLLPWRCSLARHHPRQLRSLASRLGSSFVLVQISYACRGPDAQVAGHQVRAQPPIRPLAQAEAVRTVLCCAVLLYTSIMKGLNDYDVNSTHRLAGCPVPACAVSLRQTQSAHTTVRAAPAPATARAPVGPRLFHH